MGEICRGKVGDRVAVEPRRLPRSDAETSGSSRRVRFGDWDVVISEGDGDGALRFCVLDESSILTSAVVVVSPSALRKLMGGCQWSGFEYGNWRGGEGAYPSSSVDILTLPSERY